jgi:aminomethyltransferase
MKHSPLHEKHLARNAKMADFGGWLMPIEYPGAGTLAEHAAVREKTGIFDVSHLGKASVKGSGALEFLNSMFTNDLRRIENGSAQYTLLCNENGGVIDDLIVYRNGVDDFFLVPNASNTTDVVQTLVAHVPAGITIENLHEAYAVIAVQGPLSPEVMQSLGVNTDIDYMAFENVSIGGAEVILCRTGYTGELGYELLPRTADASKVWDAIVEAMQPFGGLVCGLGARDTLRTEMGYPLHGHELSLEINPVEASATWAIGWDKGEFLGSEVLRSQKTLGAKRRSVALKSLDRGIPRAGMHVETSEGKALGEVTSGTFSPSLKVGIAIALLDSTVKVGDHLVIDVRGRDSMVEVVKLPFMPSHVR